MKIFYNGKRVRNVRGKSVLFKRRRRKIKLGLLLVALMAVPFIPASSSLSYVAEKTANYNFPDPCELESVVCKKELEARKQAMLQKIAECESGDNHYTPNGKDIVWGKKANVGIDVGRYQINTFYHLEPSMEMGLDIFKEDDNKKYAEYLYDKNGTQDWSASKKCWDK